MTQQSKRAVADPFATQMMPKTQKWASSTQQSKRTVADTFAHWSIADLSVHMASLAAATYIWSAVTAQGRATAAALRGWVSVVSRVL